MVESSAGLCVRPAPFTAFLLAGQNARAHHGSIHAPAETSKECHAFGIPLRSRRRYYELHLPETMTAHLCITTYRSPQNEVLKLECKARVMGATAKKFSEEIFADGGKLCFVGQDCHRIPSILGATYGLQTKRLDLSYNAIRSLDGLERFPYLEELVLDNNFIDDSVVLPYLDTLHTLSLNKNKVSDLGRLLDQVSERLPNLRYLSLLGNKACPDQLTGEDVNERDYRSYRLYVLHQLPKLRFLDSTAVRRSEAKEAKKRGSLARGGRATSAPPSSLLSTPIEDGVMCTAPPLQNSLPTSPATPPTSSPFHNPQHDTHAKEMNGTAATHAHAHAPRHTGSPGVTPPLSPSTQSTRH